MLDYWSLFPYCAFSWASVISGVDWSTFFPTSYTEVSWPYSIKSDFSSALVLNNVLRDYGDTLQILWCNNQDRTLTIIPVFMYFSLLSDLSDVHFFRNRSHFSRHFFNIWTKDKMLLYCAGGQLTWRLHWSGCGAVICGRTASRTVILSCKILIISLGCPVWSTATAVFWMSEPLRTSILRLISICVIPVSLLTKLGSCCIHITVVPIPIPNDMLVRSIATQPLVS